MREATRHRLLDRLLTIQGQALLLNPFYDQDAGKTIMEDNLKGRSRIEQFIYSQDGSRD